MNKNPKSASLTRRFAALVYDSFLITALLFIAAIPPTLINDGAIQAESPLIQLIFLIYLLSVWFIFYGWCWTHGGQTLGMTAWHIQVVSTEGELLSWRSACIRWCSGLLGLANLSGLLDKKGRGWHERLSNSRTILMQETRKSHNSR